MENPFAQALLQRTRMRVSVLASDVRGAAFDASLTAVASLLGLAALGCLVAALWVALAPVIGAAGAALASAALLLATGGATLLARGLLARRRAKSAPCTVEASPDLAEAALLTFSANKMALLLSALMAGALAAEAQRGK
ncbi:MAG: hypothetical protein K0B00_09010 [Rhodobacteraceae bacterium]|nr:hypothetical protein [Paracoccaceae bacterium]